MMKMTKKQRGFVLPLVVVMAVLLSIMGFGLLKLGFYARMQSIRTTAQIVARAAADAGLTKALFEMNKELSIEPSGSSKWWFGNWRSSNIKSSADGVLPCSNANYTYTIEWIARNSEYKITSTGQSGRAKKTVSATVRRTGMFDYPIFATGYAHPKRPKAPKQLPKRPKHPKKGGKLHVKGYNVESYSSNPKILLSGNLQLRTNSHHKTPVRLEKDIIIHGDVITGPGSNPDKVIKMHKDAQITGDRYVAAEVSEPPPAVVPKTLDNQKAKKGKPKKAKKDEDKQGQTISGNVKYDNLTIPEGETWKVVSNCQIYVERDMKLEEGAKLIITENSSLVLYVGEKLEVKKDKEGDAAGIINETQDPTKLTIYGTDTCRKVKLEKNEDFYGAVYAPYAKVEIKDSGDVYGALVGWDVKLKRKKGEENGNFYFDEALRSSKENVRFVIVKGGWREE